MLEPGAGLAQLSFTPHPHPVPPPSRFGTPDEGLRKGGDARDENIETGTDESSRIGIMQMLG